MTNLGAALVLLALGPDDTGTKVAYATQDVHPSSAPATLSDTSTTIVDGSFARYLEVPGGKVDGVVLEDGTVARFAPIKKEVFDTAAFRRGDPIRVRGALVLGLPLPYLVHASVSRGGVGITNAGFAPLPNGVPLSAPSKTSVGETGRSTTKSRPTSSGSKPKQADETLVGGSDRLTHKRTRLKTAAYQIRRLTTGSGNRPLDPQWSRRREDDGP